MPERAQNDPARYRPAPGSIPEEPGVYRFSDPHGRVVYVGKAKSLRQRLNSYFADLSGLHPRTRQMVTTASRVEWTVVSTEVEALQLEYNWIKEFDPRFNVRYRDDKTYPVLAVTMNEEFPRLHVYRGPRRKGVRYFGPYAHAWAIRETLDLLLRVFPARTCSNGVFRRHGQIGRPCLLGYIDKCSAPCVGRVDAERAPRHRRGLQRLPLRPHRPPGAPARAEDDRRRPRGWSSSGPPGCVTTSARSSGPWRRQAVVLGDGTDADVVAFAQDELEAAVQVFHVRGGRVRGQRGWVIDKVEPTDTAQLVERFLTQFYGEQAALADSADDAGQPVPKEILVPELPGRGRRARRLALRLRGSRVQIRVPQRGDKRALAETVARNAAESFTQHKLRRAGDLTARSAALEEIQDALGLGRAPLRIECVDVSPRAGHRRRRLARRVRGRAGPQVRVPAVRDPRRRRRGRRRVHRRGGPPPVPAPPGGDRRRLRRRGGRAGAGNGSELRAKTRVSPPPTAPRTAPASTPRPGGPASSPTRRTCSSSTAGAAGRGGRRRAGRARGHRRGGLRPGQAAGGGLAARRARPGDPLRAPARGSTCCSGCATRRTASPSPTTVSVVRRV